MPSAFVQFTPELADACEHALVLTPTERLRRNLSRAYDAYQLELGRSAWRTANVRSIDGYLRARYNRGRGRDPSLPQLLGQEAEFLAFQQTAPSGAESLIRYAMEAWRLCHQWQIPIDEQALSITDNARTFLRWARALQRSLRDAKAITAAELVNHPVLRQPTAEREIYCHSFENVPTALQNWLTELESVGVNIRHLPLPDSQPSRSSFATQRVVFDTPVTELSAVAQFARNLLSQAGERAGELRIGVVIPDLAQRYSAVVRQFTAELDPLPAADGISNAPFDIGAGLTVAEQPIWRVAADYLGLCYDTVATAAARALLNSKYLDLPGIRHWPATLPESCSLADLVAVSDNDELKPLLANLPTDRVRPMGEWVTLFERVLLAAGWSGSAAGSHQFQAYQQIRGHLDACKSSTQRCEPGDALETLQRLFASLTYAPERPPATIQIMGYLETTGLDFTHLWITGLDDQSWPRPARANPLVPVAIQLQAKVARVTPEQELAFARQRLAHWQRSCKRLIVSHASFEGESACMPSPLIAAIPQVTLSDLQPARAHPFLQPRRATLESYVDDYGSAVELGHRRGGTGLIRDQAQCPFRSWAIHRLGLADDRLPHAFPDALDRGIVIHDALHRLYLDDHREPRNPETIAQVDIESAVSGALNKSYRRFPEQFRSRERGRLTNLLEAWLQLDLARGPVQIVGLEVEQEIVLQGIRLHLRLDRIDRVDEAGAAGSLVVVDYKSGAVSTRLIDNSEAGRLIDPQLPIYACSNQLIRGVLYAQVNATNLRLTGVADAQLTLGPVRLQAPLNGDWDQQLGRWRQQLDGLANEIKNGYAAVSPVGPQICRNCHLQDFCRLSSLADALPTPLAPGAAS